MQLSSIGRLHIAVKEYHHQKQNVFCICFLMLQTVLNRLSYVFIITVSDIDLL